MAALDLRLAPASRRWIVVLAVVIYACLFQGVRPIYSPDEGRYTDVALAMLDDGDWIHPMLHHEVEHWSKPPLEYWALAASIGTLGRREFAARLPGALAFAATILVLMRLGRRFVPSRPWLPGVVYATFVLPSVAANLVTTDTLLALWETLIVASFVETWEAQDISARRRGAAGMGIFAALAFMTKGPPGLLTLAACAAFAISSSGWHGLKRAFRWEALALFVLLGLPWFAVVVVQDPNVLHYFVVEEVVNRIATEKMHRNAEWYGAIKVYAPTLIIGTLPWLPILVRSAWRARTGVIGRLRDDAELRLLLCWILVPGIVFLLARSRLPLYMLPLFAPMALLVARGVSATAMAGWKAIALGLWCALLVLARIVPAFLAADDDDRRLADEMRAVLHRAPNEIAFVDSTPRFGLRFYFGSEIERIVLPGGLARPESQDLASELTEREGCRLFVTDIARAAALEAALREHHAEAVRLDDVRGYALLEQSTADCSWGSSP